MEKIYLVISSSGFYEDYRQTVECAFRDKEEAQKFCDTLEESNKYEEVYEPKVWDDIYYELETIIEKDEAKYDNDVDFNNQEEWNKRQVEIDTLTENTLLSILHKRGLTNATLEDVRKQMVFERHKYDEWLGCNIKEIELR